MIKEGLLQRNNDFLRKKEANAEKGVLTEMKECTFSPKIKRVILGSGKGGEKDELGTSVGDRLHADGIKYVHRKEHLRRKTGFDVIYI